MDLVCRTPQPLRLRLTMHQDTHGSGRSQSLKDWWGHKSGIDGTMSPDTWNIASF